MTHASFSVGRRGLLSIAAARFVAASSLESARSPNAQAANNAGSIAPVQRLNDALLGTMRSGPNILVRPACRGALLNWPVIGTGVQFGFDAGGVSWPQMA